MYFRRAFARLLFTWDSRIVFENFKANESTAKASVSSPGNIPGEVSPTSLTRENPGSLEATGYVIAFYFDHLRRNPCIDVSIILVEIN